MIINKERLYHRRKVGYFIGYIVFFISIVLSIGNMAGCGGGGDSSSSGSSGSVSMYVTDEADLSNYKQVTATINSVSLTQTSTNTSCDLLTTEQTVDIANLADTLQLLETVDCDAQSYNRVHVEFAKTVELMNSSNVSAACSFVSYKENGKVTPNVLSCTGDNCTIDINGAVNVVANQNNLFALDFDLKEFEVENFGLVDCEVTMKVAPLNRNDIEDKKSNGYHEGVTGFVSALDTTLDTFTLTTKRQETFSVDYSGALYNSLPQPGIDNLLQFASDKNIKVRVNASVIDVTGVTPVSAATVYVKLDGLVSALDEIAHTFTLSYTSKSIVISVDYTDAFNNRHVEGVLANDVWVETKLYGYDNTKYLAHEVELEEEGDIDTDD